MECQKIEKYVEIKYFHKYGKIFKNIVCVKNSGSKESDFRFHDAKKKFVGMDITIEKQYISRDMITLIKMMVNRKWIVK